MSNKKKLFNNNDSTFSNKSKITDNLFSDNELKNLLENDNNFLSVDEFELSSPDNSNSKWKILIVDDEPDVIAITKLALDNFEYDNKKIIFFEAYSYNDAIKILKTEKDIALVFIDVVMKNNHDGLQLVKFIREEQKNNLIHIILRTGQPGYAPEKEIISNYNINFYQTKADLTERKLHTLTTSSLRSYDALKKVKNYSQTLEKEVVLRTKELLQKNKELKKVNATKNKMFSIIAHDLVNPFNSLIGFTELLKDNCRTFDIDKIQTFANILYETSDNTYKLLSNLLEWSRAQTGKIKYKPKITDINSLIKSNIELLRNQAKSKSIKIIYDELKDAKAFCDSNMVNTIIRNILSNGIKFTKNGNVTVKIKTEPRYCIISIEDTGIGIDNKKVNKLFSSENVSTDGTSGESGTGIGLLLCKEFIDKNNGQISVESRINKGSKFIIKLPIKESNI